MQRCNGQSARGLELKSFNGGMEQIASAIQTTRLSGRDTSAGKLDRPVLNTLRAYVVGVRRDGRCLRLKSKDQLVCRDAGYTLFVKLCDEHPDYARDFCIKQQT